MIVGCGHIQTVQLDCNNTVTFTCKTCICTDCQNELIRELDTIRNAIRNNPNAFAFYMFGYLYSKTKDELRRKAIVELFQTDLLAFLRVINCPICKGMSLTLPNVCECKFDTYNTPEC
jgi:hypothetical protein